MTLCFIWTILLGGIGLAIVQILGSTTGTLLPLSNNDDAWGHDRVDASRLSFLHRNNSSLLHGRTDASRASSLNDPQTYDPHTYDPQTYIYGDFHHASVAVLGLQDWEIASIQGDTAESSDASCQPPLHISKQCCLGTFSMGGDIDYHHRYHCHAVHRAQYEQLQQHAASSADCDVCRIVQLSRQYNLTTAFFGDSMTNQVVQGLICELQRRNYKVNVRKIPGKHGEVCKRCIKWTMILQISSPFWNDNNSSFVEIKFLFQYRYPFYYPPEELEVATSADILVINLGLHWSWNGRMVETGRMHYRKSIHDFLHFLKTHGTHQLLVYRETSAQHFDADGGDWGLRTNTSVTTCVAIRDYQSPAAAWREAKVAKAAKAQGYKLLSAFDLPTAITSDEQPELVVLPWWNFTAQHFEMHPPEECSHYCSSPFLYLPLWKGLRNAMDRRFPS
jgi:hypothetical protein